MFAKKDEFKLMNKRITTTLGTVVLLLALGSASAFSQPQDGKMSDEKMSQQKMAGEKMSHKEMMDHLGKMSSSDKAGMMDKMSTQEKADMFDKMPMSKKMSMMHDMSTSQDGRMEGMEKIKHRNSTNVLKTKGV